MYARHNAHATCTVAVRQVVHGIRTGEGSSLRAARQEM